MRVNERIRANEVRLIDEDGSQVGIVPLQKALEFARSKGLDLIEVAANANPPVCRVMNYGKFKYEQSKREREAQRRQRMSEMKGIRLRPKTDEHDLQFKINNTIKFLKQGHKVKVTVIFRSREYTHPEFAEEALRKMVDAVQAAGVGAVERPAQMEGRMMTMILTPGSDRRDSGQKTKGAHQSDQQQAKQE
ncbi:MAG: translation initiation factor IF-3 [Armatimonadota bacterium]